MLQDFPIQKDAPQNHILKTLASSYNHMKKKKVSQKTGPLSI